MQYLVRSICLMVLALVFTQGQAQNISNKGKEFWVGYGYHMEMEKPCNGNDESNKQNMILYLSTESQAAIVTVTIDSSGSPFLPPNAGGVWQKTYYINPNSVIASDIIPKGIITAGDVAGDIPPNPNYDARLRTDPPPAGTGGAGPFARRGIHIESNVPITAYGHIYSTTNSGASMLLPVTAWGYSYQTLNSAQDYGGIIGAYNWITIIAARDSTVVEITMPPGIKTRAQNVTGLYANATIQVMLMKGHIYQIMGAYIASDANGNSPCNTTGAGYSLSGTKVKSIAGPGGDCYPIAVFAGSSRTTNPANCGSGGGDNDNQQLFPRHAWGKKYLTVPFSNQSAAAGLPSYMTATYKIAVADPATVVTRNGTVLTGLQKNTFYSYESNTPDLIESDQPIMVSQFMTGGSCTGPGGGDGDPEMVVVAPIEQAIKQVSFYRNNKTAINYNLVTLTVKTTGLSSLRIAGSGVFTYSGPHPRLAGYSIVVRKWGPPIVPGPCLITCDSAFNALTYGLGSAESYGYSAGAFINNLNSLTFPHNIPDTSGGGKKVHNYTCVNTPMNFSILMRYKPIKLEFDFSTAGIPPGCLTVSPALVNGKFTMDPADSYLVDSPTVNGLKYYRYTLPHTFTFSCAGIYDIPVTAHSLTLIDNCGNKEYLFNSIEVKAKPNITFNYSHSSKCTKDTIYLSGPTAGLSGGTLPMTINQWRWLLPGNGGKKDTGIVLAPGLQNISLTAVSDQGCLTDTATKAITVYAPPSATIAANPDTLCLGQTTTFTPGASYGGAGVPINNYHWNFGDGSAVVNTPSATPQTKTYGAFGTYNAKLAVRVSALCVSDTAIKTIVVASKAQVAFTAPTSCLPSSGLAQFTANGTAQGGATITSYNWNFGDPASGGNNTATGPSVSHTYAPTADSFKVTLLITTNTGCTGDTTFWVNANIAPSVKWNTPNNYGPFCQNSPPASVAFGAVTNGVTGTPKYSGGAYIDSAGVFSPAIAGPGTHPVRYTFTTAKGCTAFKDTTITVNVNPNKPVVNSPVTYCQGDPAAQLTATGSGGTLTWYNNPGLTGGQSSWTPLTNAPGTFTYYVTESSAFCTGEAATITVIVQPSIAGNTIVKDTTICQGNAGGVFSGNATLSGGSGTYTYQWQQSTDATTWTDITGETSATYTSAVLNATTYFRRIVTSGPCSNTSNYVTVTVVPSITNADISSVPDICDGTAPALIVGQNTPGTGVVYTWESSTDNINWSPIPGANGKDYQPPILNTTTYYRRKVSNGPCSAVSNAVTVTVKTKANGSITGPATICQYQSADITFVANPGTAPFGISYTITNPSGASTTYNPTGLANNAVIPVITAGSNSGTYTIQLNSITNGNTCITTGGFTPVQIVVTATPVVTPATVPGNVVCEGTSVTINASGADTYSWTSSPGGNLSAATGSSVTVTPTGSGSFTYTVTGTSNSCNSVPKDVVITVNPKPAKPTVTSPVTYPQGGASAPLAASGATGNTLTYYNNAALTGGQTSPYTPSTATPGTLTYYVTQTTPSGCTSDPETITIIIQPGISGNTIANDTTICEGSNGGTLIGTGTLSGGSGSYTYQWQQSPDNSTWTDIAGATNSTFATPALSSTMYYRRVVTSGLSSATSNAVTVTVVPAITNYQLNAVPAICEGFAPQLIVGQTPPGSGIVYSWEGSTDGVNWTLIAGATGKDYQPPVLTSTIQYRRKVVNGPCSMISAPVTVTVNKNADGNITAPPGVCQYDDGKITFTATAGTGPFGLSYTVTNPSGGTTTFTPTGVNSGDQIIVTPAGSTAGNYSIVINSITNSNGCIKSGGYSPVPLTVTQTPLVGITPTPASAAICAGSTATLTANGATTYSWTAATPGGNLGANTGTSVTVSPASAGSYIYKVIGTTNSCNSVEQQVTITVNPVPVAPTVTSPLDYCQLGGSAPLTGSGAPGNTITWYDNAALTGGTTTTYAPSTATAGSFNYYVTQTNSFNCVSPAAVITINVAPGLAGNTIGNDTTICQGANPGTFVSTGTVTGGNGTYTYQWQQSTDGGATWNNIPGATNATLTPGALTTTTIFRRAVSSSLCGSVSNEVTATVKIGLSNYNITAPSSPICEASTPGIITGQQPSGTPIFIFTWQQSIDGGSNWVDIASSDTRDYQPPALTATTSYRRKLTNGPCTVFSNVVQIVVNPLPNGTITTTTPAICEYESADMVFTASAGSPLYHIEYTVNTPSGAVLPRTASSLSSGAVIPLIAVGSAPGNYQVTFTKITDNNGCTRTAGLTGLTVTVKPTPNTNVSAIPPICKGDSATLTGINADSYTWSGPGLAANAGNDIKASPASTSNYTVTGTTNGCSASRPFSITVNPRPVVNIGVQDNNICLDEQGIFNVSTATIDSGSIQNFYWDFDNGVTLVNPGSVTTTNPQSYGTHRLYVVKLYALSDKNCASVTDTAHITVNPLPVAKFDLPAFVCLPNNNATFQNQSTIADGTPMNYTWNFGDAGSGSNTSTSVNGAHVYPDSANYHITLSVISSAGCTADTGRDFAAFFRKPVASFDVSPDTLCQGSPNVFTDLSFAPGSTITNRLWSFGDGTTLNDSVNAVKTYTRPGNFKVTLVVQNTQGCTSDVAETTVKVYLQPVIDAGPSFIVPAGTIISFNATANSNSLQFAWTSPTGGTVSNPAILKPQYIADQDGKFILTATGDGNCKAYDSLTVKVLKPIGIPNAFSPNGDNINDKWNITNLADYPNCVVEVFNRYGQPVFRSFGYRQAWDGTYKGKVLPVGTYYYIIEPKNGFPRITGYVVIVK